MSTPPTLDRTVERLFFRAAVRMNTSRTLPQGPARERMFEEGWALDTLAVELEALKRRRALRAGGAA